MLSCSLPCKFIDNNTGAQVVELCMGLGWHARSSLFLLELPAWCPDPCLALPYGWVPSWKFLSCFCFWKSIFMQRNWFPRIQTFFETLLWWFDELRSNLTSRCFDEGAWMLSLTVTTKSRFVLVMGWIRPVLGYQPWWHGSPSCTLEQSASHSTSFTGLWDSSSTRRSSRWRFALIIPCLHWSHANNCWLERNIAPGHLFVLCSCIE